MPALYPKMRERSPEFRINYESPLWPHLIFSGLGGAGCMGSRVYPDMSPYRRDTRTYGGNSNWIWIPELARYAKRFADESDVAVAYNVYDFPKPGPCTVACWVSSDNVTVHNGIISYNDGGNGGWRLTYSPTHYLRYTIGNVADMDFTTLPVAKGEHYFLFLTVTDIPSTIHLLRFKNYSTFETGSVSISRWNGTPDRVSVGALRGTVQYPLIGWLADILVWNSLLPQSIGYQLADPSNVDLRVGGVPLILPPRRRFWPVVSETAIPKFVPWHLFQIRGA